MPLRAIIGIGIDPDLNKDFHDVIGKVKGCGRGFVRESLEEAIQLWIREQRKAM